jgi:hypothetical protein
LTRCKDCFINSISLVSEDEPIRHLKSLVSSATAPWDWRSESRPRSSGTAPRKNAMDQTLEIHWGSGNLKLDRDMDDMGMCQNHSKVAHVIQDSGNDCFQGLQKGKKMGGFISGGTVQSMSVLYSKKIISIYIFMYIYS